MPVAYAANITVNTTDDEDNSDGDCSLREAIRAANDNTAVDACAPGDGIDTIQFSLTTPAVITLTQGQLLVNKESVTIVGPGAELLAISGNNNSRVFDITSSSIAVTITEMTIQDGRASFDGGAIRSWGTLTLINTAFINNIAGDDGGAIDVQGNLLISATNILSNTAAGQGGGINGFGAATTFIGGRIANNRAGSVAGGAYINGSLNISGTQFISNSAQSYAGAVWAWQSAVVNNASFERNTAQTVDMGALYVKHDLSLTDSTFISNTAGQKAGAVLVEGDAHISGGLFSGNAAATGRSGALDVAGALWLTETHFIANQAGTSGGAVTYMGSDGQLVNTLFARNAAGGDGGALYLNHSGSVNILHATIVGPAQPVTSAIAINTSGAVTIVNSIVASYTLGIDVTSGAVYEDSNLFYQTTPTRGGVNSGGHSFDGDPAFVDSLNDDYHLTALSEALNTGSNAGVAADGDGDARPGGSGVDIGYDETTHVSDVGIAKTVNTIPSAGEPISYTITFSNTGTALLPRLVITDVIPAQVVQHTVFSTGIPIVDATTRSPYVWEIHNLAPGEGGMIRVSGVLTNPLARGTFTNTVEIDTIAAESDLSNNTAAISVTVPNIAPVANDDIFYTAEENRIVLNPLANDVDGDPMHIEAFGLPTQGTAVFSGTAHIVYTPTLNFNGSDTFTYTVSDGEFADMATITVTATPINDAPVIAEGDTTAVTMSEDGSPTPFSLALNADDVDGDPLTWSVTTPAAHGATAVSPGPTLSATVEYTPTANYYGSDTFVIQVFDGDLSDAITVALTIEPVNDAPTAVGDIAVALRQRRDGVIKILASGPFSSQNVLDNDADIEGSALSVTTTGIPNQGGAVNIGANGQLLVYTPTALFTGTETFTYTITDSELTDTAVFSMTVTDGIDGGVGGDSVTILDTGANDAFTITVELPTDIENNVNFALIYDELDEVGSSPPSGYVPAGAYFTLAAYIDGQLLGDGHIFQRPLTITLEYANAEPVGTGPSEDSLALYSWANGQWSDTGLTIVERDTTQHRLTVALNRPGDFGLFRREFIYLPLIMNNFVSAPDLIVEKVTVSSTGAAPGGAIQVVVANIGNSPVTDGFWVDVYIGPDTPPTAVNQTWQMLGSQGVVWGVTANALPLNPGDALTLMLDSPYYVASLSQVTWPLAENTPIYAQVDTANLATTYGAVLEIHEITGKQYNNIIGPVFSTTASNNTSSPFTFGPPNMNILFGLPNLSLRVSRSSPKEVP